MPVAAQPAEHGLQKAMYARMTADSTLRTLLAAAPGTECIFDHVPENKAYPFVTLGLNSIPWDTTSEKGDEIDVQIDAWTDGEGSVQTWAIINRIKFLFDDKEAGLVIPGHNLVRLQRTVSDVVRDGLLFHGVQRFTAITEEV